MAFVSPIPVARHVPVLPSNRTRLAARPRAAASGVRMVATEPVTSAPLSTRAHELIGYLRGHKSIFLPGVGFSSTSKTLFRKNDTGRTFTPLEELATSADMLPGGSVAALIVVQEEDLVQKAIDAALAVDSSIGQDANRKEILEYDMKYMLRILSYGAGAQSVDFIHVPNMTKMRELHDEVQISSDVDVAGLKAMKEGVTSQLEGGLVEGTAACFDVLIKFMSQ